ncbi:MAG: type II toxin-antitoxin system RelE/ParE family toxin [Novosphingobium aromaticivorans]|nr:type II toxin-antitoxin system RelE/ParE family toxin [Novosphingobium aromaticivorans]
MSHTYVLTAAAEADVRSIIRYTRQQWGEVQVRAYMAKLEQGIARLAHGSGSHRDMSDMHPGLRMARIEHHYVFCLLRDKDPSLIVAILHERMDLIQRLGDRLSLD